MIHPNLKSNAISKPDRRSIRLPGYDYSRAGAYFVTICIQNRLCLLGDIINEKIFLTDSGFMVASVWQELPNFYPNVQIDVFQIMPNHFHGIIVLQGIHDQSSVGAGPCACPNTFLGRPRGIGQAQGPAPTKILSLPDVVHRFKTMTTKRYVDGVKQLGWAPFPGKFWQRNYYEHVIRNQKEMDEIREYITNNPKQWDLDQENPNAHPEHIT
jgi:putative transposase